MPTSPLTVYVDAETARAFAAASPEDRQKIELLLDLRLRELVGSVGIPLREEMDGTNNYAQSPGLLPENLDSILSDQDRRTRLQQAFGIWRDREDLPTLAELRSELDRF